MTTLLAYAARAIEGLPRVMTRSTGASGALTWKVRVARPACGARFARGRRTKHPASAEVSGHEYEQPLCSSPQPQAPPEAVLVGRAECRDLAEGPHRRAHYPAGCVGGRGGPRHDHDAAQDGQRRAIAALQASRPGRPRDAREATELARLVAENARLQATIVELAGRWAGCAHCLRSTAEECGSGCGTTRCVCTPPWVMSPPTTNTPAEEKRSAKHAEKDSHEPTSNGEPHDDPRTARRPTLRTDPSPIGRAKSETPGGGRCDHRCRARVPHRAPQMLLLGDVCRLLDHRREELEATGMEPVTTGRPPAFRASHRRGAIPRSRTSGFHQSTPRGKRDRRRQRHRARSTPS